MTKTALVACGLASVAAFAACQTGSPGPSSTPAASDAAPLSQPAARSKSDEPNTMDGVYTAAQAKRGEAVFGAVCSECHEPSDWTDSGFLARWNEDSVFRLWYYIFERMPHGNPMTLSRVQVTDALTYIFQLNGLPAGSQELGTDDDSIDDYWIIWGGDSSPLEDRRSSR